MPQPDRSRKLFVRSVLAGTSTLATLMGAQSLAMIDNLPIDEELPEEVVVELTMIPTLATFPTSEPIPTEVENLQVSEPAEPIILKVEPSITIFRQAGTANTDANVAITTNQTAPSIEVASNVTHNTTVIQPPSPVQLAAPDPIVIVEEPVVVQPPPVQIQQQQQAQPQPQPQPQAQQNNKPKKNKSGSSR